MAIRFEPSCDDKVQWQIGAAGNLYFDPGPNNRQLSISSPLDLRYHEASDYEDRRTSSCSPDSCDLAAHDKMLSHTGSAAYDRSFSQIPHKDEFCENYHYVSSDTRALQQACRSDFLPGKSFRCTQRSKTVSDLEESRRKKAYHQPKTNIARKLSVCESTRVGDARVDEVQLSPYALPRQNGGAKQICGILEDTKRDHKRFETSGYVDSDLKIAATSEVVKSPELKKDMKNGQQVHANAGFGETDAAEALLGLSEGFYQTMQSQSGTSSHFQAKQCFSSGGQVDRPFNKHTVLTTVGMSTQIGSSDTKTLNTTSVQKEATGRKHFKKLICQKFVNSVQPSPVKRAEEPPSTIKASSNNSFCSEAIDDRAKSLVARSIKSDVVVSGDFEQKSPSLSPNKIEKPPPLTNNKQYNGSPSFLAEPKAISATEQKKQLPTKVSLKSSKNSLEESESIKKKEVSNLYRTSKSLGSSNESIAESVADDNAEMSESSSDSSEDESGNEEDEHCVSRNQNKPFEKEMNRGSENRKAFVLSKPTFSLPALAKSVGSLNDKFSSNANKTNETNQKETGPTNPACGSESKALPFLNKPQIAFGNSEASEELNKQSNIHIKKATFTFSRSGKLDKTTQQSGLSVTSQAAALLERAQCAAKDRNSFSFDRDKLDSNEAAKAKQATSQNDSLSSDRATFGTFRNGDSFENLSKPAAAAANFTEINKQQEQDSSKRIHEKDVPYDKRRLPRPSARSAELEAQQQHAKSKTGRKRKLSVARDNSKENSKLLEKPSIKRLRHVGESPKKSKSRHNKKHITQTKRGEDKTCELKQNGEQTVETNKLSAPSSLERSSSRRKPSRVYKHQKYTSVSMMSSTNSPRDSSEFSLISKPLNLDHRVLLANSIDLYRGLNDDSNDVNVSSPMTSSSCSSTTSSVASDDNDVDSIPKSDSSPSDKNKDRYKRHRHLSAIETNTKADFLGRKHKMKRLLSMNEQISRKNSVRLMTSNVLASSNWQRSLARKGETSNFRLLSLFPAPASLRPGFAHCELLPGYGPSVSGQRSSLPLRWTKGSDESDLKKKRQHQRWRNMTLDMFCMGAKS